MQNLIDSVRAYRLKVDKTEKWFQDHHDLLQPVAETADRLGGEAELCISEFPDLTVRLTGDKHKLSELVRALRTRGFVTNATPPKANDSTWSAFYQHPQICDGEVTAVYLSFSSSVCRRVKVGTKVIPAQTVDVYETVCGEVVLDTPEAPPAAPAPAPAPAGVDLPF